MTLVHEALSSTLGCVLPEMIGSHLRLPKRTWNTKFASSAASAWRNVSAWTWGEAFTSKGNGVVSSSSAAKGYRRDPRFGWGKYCLKQQGITIMHFNEAEDLVMAGWRTEPGLDDDPNERRVNDERLGCPNLAFREHTQSASGVFGAIGGSVTDNIESRSSILRSRWAGSKYTCSEASGLCSNDALARRVGIFSDHGSGGESAGS